MQDYKYRLNALQAIEQRMQSMTDRFCRTYVVRLDIRFPKGYVAINENAEFSELMKRLMEYHSDHNISTHYVGVREQKTSENHHYHLAILFDGAKIGNGWRVGDRAADIWQRLVGPGGKPGVQICRTFEGDCGIMIEKPKTKASGRELQNQMVVFNTARRAATSWLDYLAKEDTKGSAPLGARELFCSRLWV